MTLKEFKNSIEKKNSLSFAKENGTLIPPYFHITEMGLKTKSFIDCGGVVREDSKVSFQIWTSDDFDHRLSAFKLLGIIQKGEQVINESLDNLEIEIEYQNSTIGLYNLEMSGNNYILTNTKTDCLAKEECGIEVIEEEINECCSGTSCC
ncbi:MAG: hypothetical protein H8E84_08050 [Flavobacteriales bacterium]|nr:hypothetical protein [Flavobacteriales bacterium]